MGPLSPLACAGAGSVMVAVGMVGGPVFFCPVEG